jgi:hypothetical protein
MARICQRFATGNGATRNDCTGTHGNGKREGRQQLGDFICGALLYGETIRQTVVAFEMSVIAQTASLALLIFEVTR